MLLCKFIITRVRIYKLTVWTERMFRSDVLVQQSVHSAGVRNKLELLCPGLQTRARMTDRHFETLRKTLNDAYSEDSYIVVPILLENVCMQ